MMVDTRSFAVSNPASGMRIAEVPDCGPKEALRAVDVAVNAFEQWRKETPFARSRHLRNWHDAILRNEEELARTMTEEMGKPIVEARGEVRYAAAFVEWYAEEAKRLFGAVVPSQFAAKRLLTLNEPVGPVVAITPWNFPAAMVARKVAPALAAGCSVIVKPAEQAPLTALRMINLWREAGGAYDVIQVLTTSNPAPLVEALLDDVRVRKLTFTGSTEIGSSLYARAARTVKRVSLELGGHAPFLVFQDADVDSAVREVIASKFRNSGQTCVCANRIYVQEPLVASFVERLAAAVGTLRVGDPSSEETQVGPLVDEQGLRKVREHVNDAVGKGARIVVGGIDLGGLYYAPTVLVGVEAGMRILEEETFGPVAPVLTFKHEAEAVRLANTTPYGLAAYLWTRDLSRAFRVAETLDYGIIGVNDGLPSTPQAPFGGRKASGIGREGGPWGIEEYLDVKFLSIALDEAPRCAEA